MLIKDRLLASIPYSGYGGDRVQFIFGSFISLVITMLGIYVAIFVAIKTVARIWKDVGLHFADVLKAVSRYIEKATKIFWFQPYPYRRDRKEPDRKSLNLKRISQPGLRIYSNSQRIPRILGRMGVVILSTSRGIMTEREARLEGIGGEILCYL